MKGCWRNGREPMVTDTLFTIATSCGKQRKTLMTWPLELG